MGKKWNVIIGLLENKPYEVFVMPFFTKETKMQLHKISKRRYDLYKDNMTYSEDITSEMDHEQETVTRLLSTAMRHGTDVEHLSTQLNKTKNSLVSFDKAIGRVLAKYVKPKTTGEKCPNCEVKLIREEGCIKCSEKCGYSKC